MTGTPKGHVQKQNSSSYKEGFWGGKDEKMLIK